MNYLSIDVGGTYTKFAVITDEGQMIMKRKVPTVTKPLDAFLTSLAVIFNEVKTEYTIDGIALSVPGFVDADKGIMHTGGNIKCVSDLNIVSVLQEQCGVFVSVENDAKCAALAELWKGAVKDCSDAVILVCGTAVGGAVIHNRQIQKGKHFLAGEFSYIMTDFEKETYELENCLAENTGIRSLIHYVAAETGLEEKDLNGEVIFRMVEEKNEAAKKGLLRYIRHLAVLIHNLFYILDPERFALGGGISVQPLFLEMIKEEVRAINAIYPWKLPVPEIVTCEFFNDANLIGAVYHHVRMAGDKDKQI